jgi:hypothetical protein
MYRRRSVVLVAVLFSQVSAGATTMFPVERICPVGGEKFQSFEIGSTSQFGMRLDFRPNGPAAYLPWVQCPNGFVVFKDEKEFTKAEIDVLTPIVGGADYQRMRKEHTIAYLVVHLRRALGASDADLAWLILKAAWESEAGTGNAMRQRYLVEAHLAMLARAKARTAHDDEWWAVSIVAAEIERQRSRFAEALALLAALPVSEIAANDVKRALIAQIKEHADRKDPNPADFKASDDR